MLITWEAVLSLLQRSVAVHVLVIEYEPLQFGVVGVSTKVKVTLLHSSLATACSKAGVSLLAIVDGTGRLTKTGAVTSWTVIAWLTGRETFPQASVAIQVLVVV